MHSQDKGSFLQRFPDFEGLYPAISTFTMYPLLRFVAVLNGLLAVSILHAQCVNTILTIDSYVSLGGPASVTWYVVTPPETIHAQGTATFSTGDPFSDHPICLAPGCYTMALEVGTIPVNPEAFHVSLSVGGTTLPIEGYSALLGNITFHFCVPQPQECPTQIHVNQHDCDTFVFWVPDASGVQVEWHFGDGTTQLGGAEVAHSFPENGVYTVSVGLETPSCPQGVVLNVLVEVSCESSSDCPTHINVNQHDCDTFVFWVPNASGVQVEWHFGDGQNQLAGAEVAHSFPENGVYTVSVGLETPSCPQGVVLTVLVEVSCESSSDCPTQIHVNQHDCDTFVFWVPNASGVQVEWNFGDGQTQLAGAEVAHSFPENGVYTVSVGLETPSCPQGVVLNVLVEVSCESSSDCPTHINVNQHDCHSFVFWVPNASGVQVEWDFGDGITQLGGAEVAHSFPENDVYTVSVGLETPSCPQGVFLSVPVQVQCGQNNCPQLLEVAHPECGTYIIHVAGSWPNEPNTQWFVNGSTTSAGTGSSFSFSPSIPGNYLITAHYSGEGCNGPITLQTEIAFGGCIEECVIQIAATDLGGGWWEFFATGDPEVYPMYWTVDSGEPFAATWVILQELEPGEHVICAMVESEACPGVVSDCIAVLAGEPGDCTMNEVLITISGEYNGLTVIDLLEVALSLNGANMGSIPVMITDDLVLELSFCIPDGCYGASFTATIPVAAEAIDISATINGVPVEISTLSQGQSEVSAMIGVGMDCEAAVHDETLQSWNVFPNPSSGPLTLRRSERTTEEAKLYDTLGRVICTWLLTEFQQQLDVSHVAPGTYLLRVGDVAGYLMVTR